MGPASDGPKIFLRFEPCDSVFSVSMLRHRSRFVSRRPGLPPGAAIVGTVSPFKKRACKSRKPFPNSATKWFDRLKSSSRLRLVICRRRSRACSKGFSADQPRPGLRTQRLCPAFSPAMTTARIACRGPRTIGRPHRGFYAAKCGSARPLPLCVSIAAKATSFTQARISGIFCPVLLAASEKAR
jgi:hypothetical protein